MFNMLRKILVVTALISFVNPGVQAQPVAVQNNFLTLADIHFDPFLGCASKPCEIIDKLRKAPVTDWESIFANANMGMPHYGQDTNYPLLASTLAAAKKIANTQQVQYVIVLGDILGHDYRRDYLKYSSDKAGMGYREFVLKTLQFTAQEIHQAFPNLDVYTAIGNNDSYGGDYVTNGDGQFFRDTANVFAPIILNKENRNDMLKSFPKGGYYTVLLSKPLKLRLIVLNSNLFSYKAQGKNVANSAQDELDWLHNQLQNAKLQNQKVFIAMHIPVGIDVYASLRIKLFTLMELWKTQYLSRFQNELKAYAPQIDAILAAHLHSDWFQILSVGDNNEIPVTGTPSVSPIFGNNPGFKVYNYSTDTELQDFATYYYPISTKHVWSKEYDFKQVYQDNCPDCSIVKGMELLQGSGKLAEDYKAFYSVGTASQPIVDKWYPYYWCAIRKVDVQGYKECVH